jgi:hypothetical protein
MITPLPFRQIHLDFHTSPHIPDVGIDFAPDDFVRMLQLGHVNSVTVFAKCHHGYSYYPTEIGTPHPHLQRRDLLGEMIEACHKADIRVPVYTTVVWDELAWETHPEWRQLSPEGHIVGSADSVLTPGWKNLCMNTGYADYVIAQIEEILERYDEDGMFIDIVRYGPTPCVCASCLKQMTEAGIDPLDADQLRRFSLAAERRFMQRTTQAIRARKSDQSIFYNSRLRMDLDPVTGMRRELDDFTHLEIESLPGGFWGYDHFPMFVRYFQTFPRQLVAMTGRFHTAWGDFGGLRNRAALEFECFQALAHGATISIGDQLHPRGRLDPAVYQRIGEIFAEVERREPWCTNTTSLAEIGVLTASVHLPAGAEHINEHDRGALHVLEQLKHQFQFIDAQADLSVYALVVLPDAIPINGELAAKLRRYLATGGKLLITGESGLDKSAGDFVLAPEMGVHYVGPAPFTPDYLVLTPELETGIEATYHACELAGVQVVADPDTRVLALAGAPYFNRTWAHFCSHRYTPFDRVTEDPVITEHENVIYVARPLFEEYSRFSKRAHKQVLANCLRRLLPRPRIGEHDLPSTAVLTLRRQEADLIVHLLHYVHQRRGDHLDIIEDRLPLHNVNFSVRTERPPREVRLAPENQLIDWEWRDGYVHVTVPEVNGYQIVHMVDSMA